MHKGLKFLYIKAKKAEGNIQFLIKFFIEQGCSQMCIKFIALKHQ